MILPNLQFYYFGFFTEPLLYLCVPANDSNLSKKIGHIFAVFSKSIFKVLGIYSLKIHSWHGFFILVKRYYTFLHLKPKWRGQFYFNKVETLFNIRTLDCLNVWRTSPIHVSCVHLLLWRFLKKIVWCSSCSLLIFAAQKTNESTELQILCTQSFLLVGRIECCLQGNISYYSDILQQYLVCIKPIT